MNEGSENSEAPELGLRRRLVRAVLTTLAEHQDGSLPVKDLFDELAERLQLGAEDLASANGGIQRKFEREAYFALIPATKAGWLKRKGASGLSPPRAGRRSGSTPTQRAFSRPPGLCTGSGGKSQPATTPARAAGGI